MWLGLFCSILLSRVGGLESCGVGFIVLVFGVRILKVFFCGLIRVFLISFFIRLFFFVGVLFWFVFGVFVFCLGFFVILGDVF